MELVDSGDEIFDEKFCYRLGAGQIVRKRSESWPRLQNDEPRGRSALLFTASTNGAGC